MCVNVNLECVRLPRLFRPLLGADVKQLVPEVGDSSVWAVLHFARAGCALLLPRHSPHPVSFLLSVSIVTSLQASGMQSAFEFKEMWFLSSDSSKPSPVCVCTCAEHGHLRATHVGCLCLLCSRLDPPISQEATGRWRALD